MAKANKIKVTGVEIKLLPDLNGDANRCNNVEASSVCGCVYLPFYQSALLLLRRTIAPTVPSCP